MLKTIVFSLINLTSDNFNNQYIIYYTIELHIITISYYTENSVTFNVYNKLSPKILNK